MKKIICKVIEMVFPDVKLQAEERRRQLNEKRTAMQHLLDTSRAMHASFNRACPPNGDETSIINSRLHDALNAYERGRYGEVLALLPRV